MAFMEWSPALSVQVGRFDKEHQKLIGIINSLYDAMSQGKGKEQVSKTLKELVTYTQTHFKGEEEFMAQYGYSDLANHQKAHKAFVDKVLEFQSKHEKNVMPPTIQVFKFLNDWLVTHIQGTDTKYGKELAGKF
jgi:hemerythrin